MAGDGLAQAAQKDVRGFQQGAIAVGRECCFENAIMPARHLERRNILFHTHAAAIDPVSQQQTDREKPSANSIVKGNHYYAV